MLSNENIFKIGRTTRHYNNRLVEYEKDSKTIVVLQTDDCIGAEKFVLDKFKTKFIRRLDIGNEYFEGDETKMRIYLEFLVDDYNEIINKAKSNRIEQKPDDKPIETKHTGATYECETCGASFNLLNSFQDHIASQNACEKYMKKKFDCSGCGKKFCTEKSLKYHKKTICNNIEYSDKTSELDILKTKIAELEKITNKFNLACEILKK
jgi:predicted nucleic acid-binding Zn ribbon protein